MITHPRSDADTVSVLKAWTSRIDPNQAPVSILSNLTTMTREWVGPAEVAGDGSVVAVNQALVDDPKIANGDPHKAGGLARVTTVDWAGVMTTLTPGAPVAAKKPIRYRQK